MVTPSDLDYVNIGTSIHFIWQDSQATIAGSILQIRITRCMRTQQSSHEIVEDCSDKGGHRYQPLDRFNLREVLSRRRVMLMLRVMTYVFFYKLFWNWIGVVRFQVVSHEVCFDKGFVMWHFLYCSFLQIVSLWSLSIWIRIIFNTNELVNQTRYWNQLPHRQKNYGKNALQERYVVKRMRGRQNLRKKMLCKQDFLHRILLGTLSCWYSM